MLLLLSARCEKTKSLLKYIVSSLELFDFLLQLKHSSFLLACRQLFMTTSYKCLISVFLSLTSPGCDCIVGDSKLVSRLLCSDFI